MQRAHKYKDLKKRLLVIAQACDSLKGFKLLIKEELDFMFYTRFKPLGILPVKSQHLSKADYNYIKHRVYHSLKTKTITFIENGKEINLYEYFYVGNSLSACIDDLKSRKAEAANEFIKAFKPLTNKHLSHDHCLACSADLIWLFPQDFFQEINLHLQLTNFFIKFSLLLVKDF